MVPLQRGSHGLKVVSADTRAKDIDHQRIDDWWSYPTPWVVWRRTAPTLDVSGPGLERQAVPAA